MDFNFSEPMSATFTRKHEDISFSDARQKNLLQKILIKLNFQSSHRSTMNGEWRW